MSKKTSHTADKIKKRFKKKLIIAAAAVCIPFFLILLLLSFFMQGSGNNPIVIAKALDIPAAYLTLANKAAIENGIEFAFFLTLSAEAANFKSERYTNEIIAKVLEKAKNTYPFGLSDSMKDVYSIYSKYFNDIQVGPIPKNKIITTITKKKKENTEDKVQDKDTKGPTAKITDEGGVAEGDEDDVEDEDEYEYETSTTEIPYTYSSSDDFGAERTFGGERPHEGNDLITDAGVPIVSITDGVVRDMNWNDFGGNIVGILTDQDTYFYYAHMQSFNTALHEGDSVTAGDILGYVGNTGYGPPGTSGMFITHLHLQIGIKIDGEKERLYISPYNIVKYLDEFRITLYEEITNY